MRRSSSPWLNFLGNIARLSKICRNTPRLILHIITKQSKTGFCIYKVGQLENYKVRQKKKKKKKKRPVLKGGAKNYKVGQVLQNYKVGHNICS